jgi:hypothetical protein
MNRHGIFKSSLLVLSMVLFTLVSTTVVRSQPDDAYRQELEFNEIKVTRQFSQDFMAGNYSSLPKTLKLMKPVIGVLNEKYPINGEPRALLEDLRSAVDGSNDQEIRSAVLTFLYLDVKDFMELAGGFVKAGNQSRAKVYVKQSLLIYKTCLEKMIKNRGDKTEAIKKATVGFQKLNQSLSSLDAFKAEQKKVESALKSLFPSINV